VTRRAVFTERPNIERIVLDVDCRAELYSWSREVSVLAPSDLEIFIGISFNTWNGFTEGYAAVPTSEHGSTVYEWLTDMFEPDPRECSHVEYENGRARYRVSGVICEKWRELGGRRGVLGAPISEEVPREWGSSTHFAAGSVFATRAFGVREVHGAIHAEYAGLGYEASCLGLPISDEEPMQDGRVGRFEHGVITFVWGDTRARALCATSAANTALQ
jgi:uncharacterized protein with LGFP repeats